MEWREISPAVIEHGGLQIGQALCGRLAAEAGAALAAELGCEAAPGLSPPRSPAKTSPPRSLRLKQR